MSPLSLLSVVNRHLSVVRSPLPIVHWHGMIPEGEQYRWPEVKLRTSDAGPRTSTYVLLLFRQRRDAGEREAGKELERSSAAGRDMRDLRLHAGFFHRSDGISSAYHRNR